MERAAAMNLSARVFMIVSITIINLIPISSVGAPSDPATNFTPSLAGPELQPRANEAGQFGVSEQTGSPTYRYGFIVPPGRLSIQPNLSLIYTPGAHEIAEGWSI